MSGPAPEATATGTDDAGDDRSDATAERAETGEDPLAEVPSGWRIRLRAVWRLLVVTWAFLPLALTWARDRRRFLLFGGSREVSTEQRRERAEGLLETFLDLGPTFIKLGQLLSTRPDVLPRAYIEVLSRLQDQVPPADFERVEPILAADVGPVEEVFESFDREAISGASLGQVYTATLDGERVAVKVLRPDIRRRVEADLRVLAVAIPLLVRFSPEGQSFTLENLAEEFAATIRQEMDYGREAATLREVAGNFADDPEIRMPAVYGEYSTDRVLVMEYVDGAKITDLDALEAMDVDPKAVSTRLEEAYVQMIVEDGVFHADPHPGNLAVQADGTIVFYDFGMNGRLGPDTRELLFEFYVALVEEDVDRVIDVFIALDSLDPDADRDVMRKVFSVAIDNFRGRDIEQYRIEEIVAEFQGTMREFPMRLPRNMALVVRVTSVLEGVCRTLDPEFDFITVIREYVRERSTDEETIGRVREEIQSRAVELEGSLRRLPPKVERTLTRAQRENIGVSMAVANDGRLLRTLTKRVAFGAVTGAAVVGTATLYAFGEPTGAAVAGGVAVVCGLATRRTFRRQRASRDVRATAGVAERSLEQGRRERSEHARE